MTIAKLVHELNEEISDREIRLIGSGGEQLGIMSPAEALRIADEQGLDLVKISPQAVPPVCKLMNYGKFRFEQSKKEKEARKNQHVVEIKEIRMSPGIDIGDFNTKLKKRAEVHCRRQSRQGLRSLPRPRDGTHGHRQGFAGAVCPAVRRDGQSG